jgi:HlyD family type I secretion membrane fusion protein
MSMHTTHRKRIGSAARLGTATLAVTAAILVGWALAAPLDGAVIASGFAKPELSHRTVQHLEGGIVRVLHVRDGDHVEAGQPLLELTSEEISAALSVFRTQAEALQARRARLQAELDEVSMQTREDPGTPSHTGPSRFARTENQSLGLSRAVADREQAFYREQIAAIRAQIKALEDRRQAERAGTTLAESDVDTNQQLQDSGFVSRSYVMRLRRSAHDSQARSAESEAELALARQRLNEVSLKLANHARERRLRAASELALTESSIAELDAKVAASAAMAERLVVRAPVAGVITAMSVSSPGAVIQPHQVLMSVVPAGEPLIIEARVAPEQVVHVAGGQKVDLRRSGLSGRSGEIITGEVRYVAPDRERDPHSGQSFFVVRIACETGLAEGVRSGEAFEVFIRTASRTTFAYLASPVRDAMLRAMREP